MTSVSAAAKPKVAFYWCSSCGGCEEAVVDLADKLLDVAGAVDIVLWPVAMDFKRHHVEALEDDSVFVSFVNGAIRTTEQEEMALLLRRKSKILVAFGSCAHTGGVPGLANLWDRESIFRTVYLDSPSTVNPEGVLPRVRTRDGDGSVVLPGFYDTVRTLDQVTEVDYILPGCAPTHQSIQAAVEALLSGTLPPVGSVLAPDHGLCEDCPRAGSKPVPLVITEFKRPHQVILDEAECLLAQGVLCMGPATRSGCGAQCIQGNMPCTGCWGPTSRVRDQGAKALSAFASLLPPGGDAGATASTRSIPDPVGTLYRYGLPGSLLARKRMVGARPDSEPSS